MHESASLDRELLDRVSWTSTTQKNMESANHKQSLKKKKFDKEAGEYRDAW